MRVLFFYSDIVFFFFYYIIGYRKAVIYTNLARSFPTKSYEEIKHIAKQYYRYMTDLFFENINSLGSTKKRAKRLIYLENLELVEGVMKDGKSAILVTGHYGNWEYLSIFTMYINLKVAYKEQKGPVNLLMRNLRLHYRKDQIIPMQHLSRYMLTHKDEQRLYVLIADQSPAPTSKAWVNFLHQDTLFFEGAEKMATKLDLPVVYVELLRIKRGHYKFTFTNISNDPKQTEEFEITRTFARLLEESINRHPQYWLWSHKRWKHRRTVEENKK
jgi:KDO2-lipid IV(A) lauroyltransferase